VGSFSSSAGLFSSSVSLIVSSSCSPAATVSSGLSRGVSAEGAAPLHPANNNDNNKTMITNAFFILFSPFSTTILYYPRANVHF
jgi:hypothetical protein